MAKKKMVKVAKGKKVPKAKAAKMRKKAGGSNVGKYKDVKASNFAGSAGDAPKYSYPINTKERAKSALKLAHNAPDPEGIKRKVYKKYPELKPKGKSNGKKK
jgi:hypothetical protein